jgi:hypothetical protein
MDETKGNPTEKTDVSTEQINKLIESSVGSNDLPKMYCNGFTVAIGNADILLVLQNNQQPVAVLNMSFTIAKTLVQKLNGLVGMIETKSGNTIMTTDDLSRFLITKDEGKKK